MKTWPPRWAAPLMCLLLLTACGESDFHAKDISHLMPELAFELTDEQGRAVEADDYQGRVQVLFFGFTHCQMVCPTTMAYLDQVLADLPDGQREQVRVLFVGVDPARDTPAALRQFTDNFGPEFVGLSGTEAQLRSLAKRYRTTFGYGEPNAEGHYQVSHSNAIFVFDRQGRARLLMKADEPREKAAEDLRKLLQSPS
ncbi:SCO family protein [Marinobacteraceae bacterium S3BR75-40.1]